MENLQDFRGGFAGNVLNCFGQRHWSQLQRFHNILSEEKRESTKGRRLKGA